MGKLPSTAFWSGRKVFLTGHKGFKASWLAYLLSRLGATTTGFGHDRRTPLLHDELAIANHHDIEGDINDLETLTAALRTSKAEILIHLAAQPIVLTSYEDPIGTFTDNIMGTARVLEAARHVQGLRSILVVTSDKVYQNDNCGRPFRETDALGGADPYSASKAAAEIVASAMARSFFSGPDAAAVASVRAGNVIGGGDWADYRLLPDAARAYSKGEPLVIRNPDATRPWQHVLEPLAGYLLLAEILDGRRDLPGSAWNFGPAHADAIPVRQVANIFTAEWGDAAEWIEKSSDPGAPKEAGFLSVDASLASRELGWTPKWRVEEAVRRTAAWYRDYFAGVAPATLLDRDIDAYLSTE